MIGAFLNQTLTRQRFTGNALGQNTVSEATYKCRLEVTTVRVAGDQGEYRERQFRIYTEPDADIKQNDRILLDEQQAQTGNPDPFVVKSVFQARGFWPSHLEISV